MSVSEILEKFYNELDSNKNNQDLFKETVNKLNDYIYTNFEKIKNMSNDSWICDVSLNLWVEILRHKFPNTYIYDTYFTEVYLNRGFDAVKNWFKKVILITNPRLILLLLKKYFFLSI